MIRKLTLISWLFLMVGLLPVMAQGDDLQEFINNAPSGGTQTRASDGFTVVDLSKFSATERTTTLEVTNGQKIRFVNGTLKRGAGLTGAILKIDGGANVEVSSSDGTYKTRTYITNNNVVDKDKEAISLGNGTLTVKNYGWVDGATDSKQHISGTSVAITSNDAVFYLQDNDGWVTGPVVDYQYADAKIEISGGAGFSGGADWCEIQSFSDVITSGNVWLHVSLTNSSNIVKFTSVLKRDSQIKVNSATVGRKVAEGYNYTLTESDRQKLSFVDSKGTELNTYLKNNAIYIGETDDLQAFINSTPTNAGGYTEVDLSKFNAINRTKTLEITAGRKIRFVNGWLNRMSELKGPLVHISANSKVELSSSDGTNKTQAVFDSHGVLNGYEIVRLECGSIIVKDYGWISTGYDNESCDPAIQMTASEDCFILKKNGTVSGPILGEKWVSSNQIILDGGQMNTGNYDYGTINTYSDVRTVGDISLHINLLGKDKRVYLCSPLTTEMQITAPSKVHNDILVSGIRLITPVGSHKVDWDSHVHILDQDDFANIKFVNDKGMSIYFDDNYTEAGCVRVYFDDLGDFIKNLNNGDGGEENGKGTEEDPYKGYVPCSGMNVDKDVNFEGDDLQYYLLYGKMPSEEESSDDCDGTVRQNDGDVYVDKGSTVTFRNIYWYGCGCNHYIYVSGTLIIDVDIHIYNYLRFIHLLPGGRVIIRGIDGEVVNEVIYVEGGTVEYHGGDTSGGKYGWYNIGGTVYIYDGTIKGGTCGGYTGNKGITYIYGGTVAGGVMNYGTTYIYGGTISGGSGYTIYNYKGGNVYIYGGTCSGNGTIWNEGNLYLDGGGSVSVNISDIYMIKGCHIYIMNRLTYVLRLHITVENIILDTPIIIGGNGYRLTQADCGNLQIELPDGYAWRFDSASGGIIIYSTTGIENIDGDTPRVVGTYDASGGKIGEARKGINVEKMSDGTVRKVIVK